MSEIEIERLKARVTALERVLRVDAIQATGDAVDTWWHVVQDQNASPEEIESAGMAAAKEVLTTKNRRRRGRRTMLKNGDRTPSVK